MNKSVTSLVALALMVAASGLCLAREKEQKKELPAGPLKTMLKSLKLTEEQSPRLLEIAKEFDPKLQEVDKAINDVLTKRQQQARDKTIKENREKNIKGFEAEAVVDAAVRMNAKQKAKTAELQAKRTEILASLKKQLSGVLSKDQLTRIPEFSEPKGKKK